jgi:hypothetical protein
VEHDLIATTCGHHLPIAPPKWPIGPPTIFNQPRFSDRINGAAIDEQRVPVVARDHSDTTWNR